MPDNDHNEEAEGPGLPGREADERSRAFRRPNHNRRKFLGTLFQGIGSFSILPGAGRMWKAERQRWLPNPNYAKAPYQVDLMLWTPNNLSEANQEIFKYQCKFEQMMKEHFREFVRYSQSGKDNV